MTIMLMMMVFSSSEDYYYFNNNNNNNDNNNNDNISISGSVDDGVWVDDPSSSPSSASASSEINYNYNDDDYYNEQQTTIDFYKRLCGTSLEELTTTSNAGSDWNQTIELCRDFYNGTWPLTATTTFNATTINNNPDYNNDDYNDYDDGYLNPNLRITLIVLLSLMIVCTIIGNILVCLSVILVRKLRHPSNYLLVSLAISDLCVAILVMPLALHSELSHTWQLSNAICDLWVSFDVTCCTSSILNLCTISIDRYLAITKPLTYGVRRTTKRILSFIVCVWVASCLISIPPVLILGNEHGSETQPRCEVSQNLGYQLYATLGAFYIPLLVMIVMYYKIYMAAKRVVDAELRDQRPSSTSMAYRAQRSIAQRFYSIKKNSRDEQQQIHQPTQQRNKQYPPIRLDKNRNYWDKTKATPDELEELNNKNSGNRKRNKKRSKSSQRSTASSSSSKRKSLGKICHYYCCCCCCGRGCGMGHDGGQQSRNAQQNSNNNNDDVDDHDHDQQPPPSNLQPKTSTASLMVNSTTDGLTTTCSVVTTTTTVAITPPAIGHHKHLNGHQKLLTAQTSNTSNISSSTGSNHNDDNGNNHNSPQHHQHHQPHPHQHQHQHHFGFMKKYHRSISGGTTTTTITNTSGGGGGGGGVGSSSAKVNDNASSTSTLAKQRASNALRERKASVTLGIIMTAFTVCWLPFFILALLRPFSASVMDIPRYVNSIALWLGYANSMLNPIIYVTFHQDFRRAFKYLLCLQCRSMGSKLRAEAYLSQYGNKKFNTANNNNNNNNNIDNHSKQPPPPQQHHHSFQPSPPTTTATAKMVKPNHHPNHPDSESEQQQRLLNPDGPIASSSSSAVMIHDHGTIAIMQHDDDDDTIMFQDPHGAEVAADKNRMDGEGDTTEASPGEQIGNFVPTSAQQPKLNVLEGVSSSTSVTNTTTTTNAVMMINSNSNNSNSNRNGGGCG